MSDYLTHLYKHCLAELEKKMTKGFLSITAIDFWFSHPAIWSEPAKESTRRATEKAGFGTRTTILGDKDTIHLVPEPEAAAMATLRRHQDRMYQPKVVFLL